MGPLRTIRGLGVAATAAERAAPLPGDDVIPTANVAMDRAFTIAATPEQVWPWLVQLGKGRAGWYLPQAAERLVPRERRAVRRLEPRLGVLAVGDVVPDYGGPSATFTVASLDPPYSLVYRSQRGHLHLTWALTLAALEPTSGAAQTRVHLRLRLAPVRRPWLARSVGELVDVLTVAGLAAGLRERVLGSAARSTPRPALTG